MNDKERLIWGKYFSRRATRQRQELEDLDELLNELGKPFMEEQPKEDAIKPIPSEVEKLPWITRQGSKGEYSQTSKTATNNHVTFQALQKYVKEHGGFCALNGFRYWFDRNNEDVIDRRKI